MEREIPTPGPIKVLRFPADGTPPHLLTLETLIADPPPEISRSQIGYYHTMLEHLLDNDLVRHVPNVRVFWTPKGWEQRCVVKFRYTNKTTPDLNGGYCLLMTDAEEGLQANRYLSNEKDTYFGDAFVLKEVGYHWLPGADLKDTVGCLLELRHEHLFPEYENVPQGILGSSILEVIRKDCFDNHVKPEGPAAGSASGVPGDSRDAPIVLDDKSSGPTKSREAPVTRRKEFFFDGSTKEEELEYSGRSDTS